MFFEMASQDLYTTGLERCLPTSNLPKQIINGEFFCIPIMVSLIDKII